MLTSTLFKRLALATSVALTLLATSVSAGAAGPNQCIAFDASWNLLAFNFDGKDYSVPAANLASGQGADITASSSRPPFDAPSSPPLCFLSQFTNAIYVLNADASDASSIYIFDVAGGTWTKQETRLPAAVATAGLDITKGFNTILDRDTNVFYALSTGGMMFSLDMALKQNASAEAAEWNEVQTIDFAEGYERPTMGLAQNHIHFMGVPGLEAGVDRVFVIHYSYLQPEPQTYTPPAFPSSYGRTASFFKNEGWQTQFAFIPDDASSTYVIDVTTNTTTTLAGPPAKDAFAQYTASPNALVQLASEGGGVQFIGWNQEARRGEGEWVRVAGLSAAANTPGSASEGLERESSSGAGAGAGGNGGSGNGGNASGGSAGADNAGAREMVGLGLASLVGLVGALGMWML